MKIALGLCQCRETQPSNPVAHDKNIFSVLYVRYECCQVKIAFGVVRAPTLANVGRNSNWIQISDLLSAWVSRLLDALFTHSQAEEVARFLFQGSTESLPVMQNFES